MRMQHSYLLATNFPSLVFFRPDGDQIQTISFPVSSATTGLAVPGGANQKYGFSLPGDNPLTNKGSYSRQSAVVGLLSRSGNGEWLSVAGTSGPLGTAWSSTALPWTFALVNYNGCVCRQVAGLVFCRCVVFSHK